MYVFCHFSCEVMRRVIFVRCKAFIFVNKLYSLICFYIFICDYLLLLLTKKYCSNEKYWLLFSFLWKRISTNKTNRIFHTSRLFLFNKYAKAFRPIIIITTISINSILLITLYIRGVSLASFPGTRVEFCFCRPATYV